MVQFKINVSVTDRNLFFSISACLDKKYCVPQRCFRNKFSFLFSHFFSFAGMPSTIEPNSGVKFELVASLSLIEQNWLESHPLNVYDSAGGTQNDTVLITDSALVKYELINCHFRQIWAKPLPRLTKNDKSFERTSASLYRVFITACGDVVLRTYPTTARFNPYLEENFHKQSRTSASASGVHQPTSSKNQVAAHANNESSGRNQSGIEMVGSSQDTTNINQTTSSGARPKQPIQQSSKTPGTSQSILKSPAVSHSSIYSGDYGQLVGVGDDRLLYWMRPVVQVYRLPGHQLLCELAGVGAGNLWTWVAVCVHPETSEMAVLDWGTKTLSVFSADGKSGFYFCNVLELMMVWRSVDAQIHPLHCNTHFAFTLDCVSRRSELVDPNQSI